MSSVRWDVLEVRRLFLTIEGFGGIYEIGSINKLDARELTDALREAADNMDLEALLRSLDAKP